MTSHPPLLTSASAVASGLQPASSTGTERIARISVLASFTVAPLVPYLTVEAARQGFAADVRLGTFNAVLQDLLEPSAICAHQSDVVIVAQLLEDVCPPLAHDYLGLDADDVRRYSEEIVTTWRGAIAAFRARSHASVILHNFSLPSFPLQGIHEAMAAGSQTTAIRALNARLVDMAASMPGVHVLDFDRVCGDVGYPQARDERLWCVGRAPLSARLLPALARAQATFVRAALHAPRKCLVLDLDDTLWGGVLGEVGPSGIHVGQEFPGLAYRQFQHAVLALSRQGVLLAINSRNNQPEIDALFASHPDLILRPQHFAATRVNWRPKPENMIEIAAELRINVDSLVFFDDSPVERELMRLALPQVLTIDVPPDPTAYARALFECRAFDRLGLTNDDRQRTSMYHHERTRTAAAATAGSLRDFLISLELKAHVAPVDVDTRPRIVDLLQKTNQFNVTTRRHSASRVAEMMADPRVGLFSLRLADRFGDHGLVGLAIVVLGSPAAMIDTFLLSCRVIGRTAETALLSYVTRWARARGARELIGEFVPTGRNLPAEHLYRDHGFTRVVVDDDGRPDTQDGSGAARVERWRLGLDTGHVECPPYITLTSVGPCQP